MHTAFNMIWNHVTLSIPNEDNHNTSSASKIQFVYPTQEQQLHVSSIRCYLTDSNLG